MNESINKFKQSDTADANLLLIEIVSILYQVNNLQVAQEMILDTLMEQFGLKNIALAIYNEMFEEFRISESRGLADPFSQKFQLGLHQKINSQSLPTETSLRLTCPEGKLVLGSQTLELDQQLENIILFPILFHEEFIGFILIAFEQDQIFSEENEMLVNRFANLLGPVIYTLDPAQKSSPNFENIISKIVKDRLHESRLVLNPISFSIFRLVLEERLVDSLILEDMVRNYQKTFHEMLSSKGDLVWLTADTFFFVYSNADLFVSEQLASALSEQTRELCARDLTLPKFCLKHASISYPQSGADAAEIVNKLWLKLFEELYSME